MFDHNQLTKLMKVAYDCALESPDPSSQTGAVIVNTDGEVLVTGYNHFYTGIPPELEDRDEKLKRITHSERDAIFNAARKGIKLEGTVMIAPWMLCEGCARAVIGSGFSAIVFHMQRNKLTDKRWSQAVATSLGWVYKAGIKIFEFDGEVPGAKSILISGRLWSPARLEYV